jgi:hypothetical protein
MTNTEGLIFVYFLFYFFGGVIGALSLTAGYYLLRHIGDPLISVIILITGMVINWVYAMQVDAPMMIAASILLGIPLAVLVPLYVFPSAYHLMTRFSRVLICYSLIGILGAILPFIFIISELSMSPFFFWHTPLSNGLVYFCLMAGVIGLATLIYGIMNYLETKKGELHTN